MDALEYVCTAKIYVEIFKNKKVGAITRRQNKNIYIYKYKYIFSVVRERSGEWMPEIVASANFEPCCYVLFVSIFNKRRRKEYLFVDIHFSQFPNRA